MNIIERLAEAGVDKGDVFFGLFMLLVIGLIHWFLVSQDCCFSLIKGNEGYYVVSPDMNRTGEAPLIIALAQWVFYNSITYIIGIIAGVAFVLYARIYPSL
jgi:hypothetical protein